MRLGASLLFLACLALTAKPPKQDLSWKRYTDADQGFCVAYPNRWIREQASDGSGVSFHTGIKRFSLPTGEIDVTATTPGDDPAALLRAHLEGVKKFVHADEIELTEQRSLTLDGTPAMFAKDHYHDPMEKAEWHEEMILASHNGKLYRLEMVCRADELPRFEAMFEHLVQSFEFDCNSKR
jgi:PsbP